MKILNFKECGDKLEYEENLYLLGFCTIQIPKYRDIVFKYCPVFKDDEGIFFQFPRFPFENEGETVFYDFVLVKDDEELDSLQKDFLKAFENYKKLDICKEKN